MATTKTRINISVPKPVKEALKRRAKYNQEPVATTAARLLEEMLDIEEDLYFSELADKRLKSNKKLIKNSDALWG